MDRLKPDRESDNNILRTGIGCSQGVRVHTDKAYSSQKHRAALKLRGIKNGIQDKAAKDNSLMLRQLQRNSLIAKVRYVVERTFGSQVRWFNAKIVRYHDLTKAHA
ncbi:MAG: transposase [Nitrosomonas sp.]|nr:transposase [Nitrosomonas sp.]MBP7112347.1 transposase [Nitrosomonas sp.]